MFHRRVLMNFGQPNSEPLYSAWWRYKDLLIQFPYHGFLKEFYIQLFLHGLQATTRNWVERGNDTTSFYQQSIDEAYYLLEDMAEFDYWNLNCSMNNYYWENNSYLMEPWIDTRYQDTETSFELLALFAYHMEKMDQNLEWMKEFREESYAIMRRTATMAENFKELNALVSTMNVLIINIDDCRFEEPTQIDKHLELFHDDAL